MKKMLQVAAPLVAASLVLSACGSAPEGSSGSSGSKSGGSSKKFLGCMVSDSGGFNDKSFNEAGYNGLMRAKKQGVVTKTKTAESNSESDYTPNVTQMVKQKCDLTLTVGFNLAGTTEKEAKNNPKRKFAIIDAQLKHPQKNVKPILFDTVQAAYLAGYLAAAETKTGTIGTFGGQKIPTVTIFMDGFAEGAKYYNKKNHKNVKVVGWNKKKQDGTFTGNFTDASKGKQVSDNLISQGADIIMPVAGPVGSGAAAAAKSHDNVNLIWVDQDGYKSMDKKYRPLIISSVVKKIGNAVDTVLKKTKNGHFSNKQYVGTLKNKGVALAPYHDWDSKVSSKTKKQIKDLRQKIINGDIKAKSPSSPKK